MASKVFKVPLKKHYADNFKIAGSNGQFYSNFSFLMLNGSEDDLKIESKIVNIKDISYYGKLWFSNSEPTDELDFLFDTGSSWLWASTMEWYGSPYYQYLPSSQYYD